MSLIAELKRRNVFRVGAAYAIVGWLLIEVASVLLPTFEAPDWVMKAFSALVILGFPLALILAWAFELTPGGIKRDAVVDRSESIRHLTGRRLDFMIIGLLSLAVVYFAVDKFAAGPEPEPAETTAERTAAAETVEQMRSIAVLPFVNMSSDPEQEYFSDGLSEEILNLLARISDLKVIGRTSSFAFKGKNEDLRGIGKALGVDTVLEGSVRKSGERVRVTAQLIDVSDGTHIWSDTYDRTMTDIFAVQDDVASSIIDALHIHIGVVPTRGQPTESSEAYALFLRAKAAVTENDMFEAESLLLKAIELDPTFAEAYETLAYTHWSRAGVMVDAAEGQRRTYDAASRAIATDPSLAFAQVFAETANPETYTYLKEVEGLERVLRGEPSNSAARDALIYDLLVAGYLREALELSKEFVELDPLLGFAHGRLTEALLANGRIDEAIRAGKLAIELGALDTRWPLAAHDLVANRDDEAMDATEIYLEEDQVPEFGIRRLVARSRDPKTGEAHLDSRIPEIVASLPEEIAYNMKMGLNLMYLYLGFLDRFYEVIFASDLSGYTDADVLIFNGTIHRDSGFTAHPRYLELSAAIGLIEVWEHRGPPDFCEKQTGGWVCE